MVNRKSDLQERRDLVLGIVVNEYIKTVAPVSSGLIVQEYHLDLSPATIRNILAELEEVGLLTHPHTSAGRVPTQRGYRYFVDHLMHEIQLLEKEKELIKAEYKRQALELEKLLEKTTQLLADTTHYTGIISVDGWEDKLFYRGTSHIVEYPDYEDINKIRHILHALEEKERLLSIINRDLENKIQIYIGRELDCEAINSCSLAVASYKKSRGVSGRIAVLGPTRMNYEKVVSTLRYIADLIEEIPLESE